MIRLPRPDRLAQDMDFVLAAIRRTRKCEHRRPLVYKLRADYKARRECAMLLGLSLFYVGAVLILNGLWMLGRIGEREIAVINLFTGGLTLLVSLKLALGEGADAESIKAAALSLLFSLTYLWFAFNRLNAADGRGLGWFSLFVAITAVPVAIDTLSNASTRGGGGSACRGQPGHCCGHCFSCCWSCTDRSFASPLSWRSRKACSPAGCRAICC